MLQIHDKAVRTQAVALGKEDSKQINKGKNDGTGDMASFTHISRLAGAASPTGLRRGDVVIYSPGDGPGAYLDGESR